MASIFTKILNKEIPSFQLYEDKDIFVILDASPNGKGHSLVITKEEYKTISDVPDEMLSKVIIISKMISIAIFEALQPDGIKIIQNNGKIANQSIPHYHMHIIPKYKDPKKNIGMNDFGKIRDKIVGEIGR